LKGLELSYSPEVNSFVSKIDKTKLREVFMNLVDNALNYTPKGSVVVRAITNGSELQVSVKDSGIGIPKEQITKLFQRFSRLENAKKMRPDGTGIGLFISKT
ncbi:sensor histidine kinase, partial [Bacillus subtilis]|uniref:sensor histidine kinase n=1 Tax=Bacillus subtilis TaxID=1423 RepID=UPI003C2A0E1A